MTAEIMDQLDVRDMLCAQALAQVDARLRQLAGGEPLDVLCNGAEVIEDLLTWARQTDTVVFERRDTEHETHLILRRRGSNEGARGA